MKLNLKRPIVFFDLETTGVDTARDRIVEISMIKVMPDGEEITRTRRLNPGMHIPAEATAVHGITDDDVKECPTFAQVAKSLEQFIRGCDFGGFNSNRFDLPVLVEEFLRAGVDVDLKKRKFIDVQNIFHKKEQRTLVAAYKFYCDKDLDDAHSAEADTRATYEVLKAQLDRYPDLENDVAALADFSARGEAYSFLFHGLIIQPDIDKVIQFPFSGFFNGCYWSFIGNNGSFLFRIVLYNPRSEVHLTFRYHIALF